MEIKKLSIEEAENYIGKEVCFWTEQEGCFSNIYKGILKKVVDSYLYSYVIEKETQKIYMERIGKSCPYINSDRGTCFQFCGIKKEQMEFEF